MLLDLKSLRAGREADSLAQKIRRNKLALALTLAALVVVVAGAAYAAYLIYKRPVGKQPPQRLLARVTFDAGLQNEPTWSPDGRFIAYSSDKGGNFDIWVQPVGGGDAVQVTRSTANDWQPDWSPDGSRLVFRSERDSGGLYTVPVLGGQEQRISTFGHQPRWSPDGSQIIFTNRRLNSDPGRSNPNIKLYVMRPGGGEPREVLADFMRDLSVNSLAWHPDGQRITILDKGVFWTVPLDGGTPVNSRCAGLEAVGEFRWAPTGDALYFQGVLQDVRNLWMVPVDPQSLRCGRPERLTTGTGPDTDIAISPDGTRLAFGTRIEDVRVWSLPFDARAGTIAGAGQPVTAGGILPCGVDMTRDGKKLVFIARRTGTINMSYGRNHLRTDESGC